MPKRVVRVRKASSWHPRMDVTGPISGTGVVVAVRLDRCVDATWYGYVHKSNEEVVVRSDRNGTYHGDEILHIPDVTPLRLDDTKAMVVARVGRCEISDACALTIASLCAMWTESPAMDLLARGKPVRMEDVADDLSANFDACDRRPGNRFDSLNMFATWMLNHPSRRAGSPS